MTTTPATHRNSKRRPAARKAAAAARTRKVVATHSVSFTDARGSLSEWINRVHYRHEWIIVHRRGKPAAALVSMEDLALLKQLEDKIDLERAREALSEPGEIPWDRVKVELGL